MKAFHIPSKLCGILLCLASVFGLAPSEALAAGGKAGLWKQTEANNLPARGQRVLRPQKFLTFRLNQTVLNQLLVAAPLGIYERGAAENRDHGSADAGWHSRAVSR